MTDLVATDMTVSMAQRHLVDRASFALSAGALVGLIGPNGAGKSTLMRALCGLVPLAGGSVMIGDTPLAGLSREALARQVAYMPQRHTLHWQLNVRETIGLGRLPHTPSNGRLSAEDHRAIDAAIERADVGDFLDRSVNSLSGGERARVMLARALAVEAPILLVDEPVAALDPYYALQIMELLRDLAREGRTVLMVLHDLTLAMRFCDRLMLMRDGVLIGDGPAREALDPAALGEAYRVDGVHGEWKAEPYLVPWGRLAADEGRDVR